MKTMLKAACFGTLTAGLIFAACSPFGGASIFNCEQDSQCAPNGTCRQPEALCVFPNESCASGEQYGAHSGSMSGKCVGGDLPPVDAPLDAPTTCTPSAKSCFNHAVETCRADGEGFDPALKQQCAITCTTSGTIECTGAATNIALTDQQMCNANGTALSLSPPTGATVTINATEITCTPACNAANQTTIPRTAAAPNNFFCLSSIMIPAGVTVTAGTNITNGVTLFSHGAVVINSDISFSGGNAAGVVNANNNDDTPGTAGPGGFPGANPSGDNAAGQNGPGPTGTTCGGRGGGTGGGGGDRAGAGGGGAGNHSNGGTGGDARNGQNQTVAGGAAGNTTTACSTPELKPLVGGAGGGGGGDGACGQGNACGWPGGGGGGALHIVSRSMISGIGNLDANGGEGFGVDNEPGGAGGGGAGGGILLEAPMVSMTGALRVNGGTGGKSNAVANGGAGGATGTPGGTDGGDAVNANQGGAGGGGAGGRIRINASNAACTGASPTASCTTGALRTAP